MKQYKLMVVIVRKRKTMTFKEYQKLTSTTAAYHTSIDDFVNSQLEFKYATSGNIIPMLNLAYVGLGLGEVGEAQGKIKKIIRDSNGIVSSEARDAIGKELGDILWYVSETATQLGLELDDVARENIEKLKSRKERGVIKGEGDNR
jgi:NTP pyrophosphatase (non-canonical NTP hydrolase)